MKQSSADLLSRLQAGLPELEARLVQDFLPAAAYQQYLSGDIGHTHLSSVVKIVRQLSEQYVSRREGGQVPPISSTEQSVAYAMYFGLVNYWRAGALLSRVADRIPDRPLRLLDFGCGSGAASLAVKSVIPELEESTLIDSSRPMLQTAAALLRNRFPSLGISTQISGTYDLIFAANVLNEMPVTAAAQQCLKLLSLLSPRGLLIILEPALFETARNLMEIRDRICEETQSINIVFPCTHNLPCPMRAKYPKDWCHGEFMWERPALIRQLDEILQFNKYSLKYSALVLKNEEPVSRVVQRIVFPPDFLRGGWQLGTCGSGIITHSRIAGSKREKRRLHDLIEAK